MTQTAEKYYKISEAVFYLKERGFAGVTPDALRRWEMIEKLIKPAKRLMGTKVRAYSENQMKQLQVIALLKEVGVATITIHIFINAKSKLLRDAMRTRLLKECRAVLEIALNAEEILNNV